MANDPKERELAEDALEDDYARIRYQGDYVRERGYRLSKL